MLLETIKSKGLAHSSYYLSDGGEAAVIDPRRDCKIYVEIATHECSEIRYIFETHRNEDYVIGSVELQEMTNAEICHSKETAFRYGKHVLSDGESFRIGRLNIEAIHAPGHTLDSMCFAVYDGEAWDKPLMVFSGDTLFVGDVGRTDLPGLDLWEDMSKKLYDSLHAKILPLGDNVLLYPSHTAGSVCGSLISDREMSTIGFERITNPQLKLDREEFVENRLKNKMLRPPYFKRMENWNLNGPLLLNDQPKPQPLNTHQFEAEWKKQDSIIVDTREPDTFVGSHIPGSINIWLDGVSFFPGWIIDYDKQILLLTERNEDVEVAITYLHRIGFDNIAGYLCSPFKVWRNEGKSIETLGTISAIDTKKMLESKDLLLLDVREESEWEAGHIGGAKRIYVGHLQKDADKLPKDKPIVITCTWGGRAGLAASILKRRGFEEVYNLLGGMNAWENLGYPLSKD